MAQETVEQQNYLACWAAYQLKHTKQILWVFFRSGVRRLQIPAGENHVILQETK